MLLVATWLNPYKEIKEERNEAYNQAINIKANVKREEKFGEGVGWQRDREHTELQAYELMS